MRRICGRAPGVPWPGAAGQPGCRLLPSGPVPRQGLAGRPEQEQVQVQERVQVPGRVQVQVQVQVQVPGRLRVQELVPASVLPAG